MRSMTGYGRRQLVADGREMTLEIKTVNHRFLDIACRLPRSLAFLEDSLRKQIGSVLKRGHVDVSVTYTNTRSDARIVRVDGALAQKYQDALNELAAQTGAVNDVGLTQYAALPEVLIITVAQDDQEALLSLASVLTEEVLSDVCRMRDIEGEALRSDLTLHLDTLKQLTAEIAVQAPKVPQLYRERLMTRLQELGADGVDEQRLAQEVALMADRCAIDEELSRLQSHDAQMRDLMAEAGEVGRKLDFLTQELNREVNTIGSKASDIQITRCVVAAKSEIEKLREQVQNVE